MFENSPAKKAGLEIGDQIIEVKNNKYTTKKVEEPEVVTKQEIEEIEQLDEEDLALFDPLGIFNIENESKEERIPHLRHWMHCSNHWHRGLLSLCRYLKA